MSFLYNTNADDKNFVNYLLNLCIELDIKVVLPLVTKELFKLSANKQKFTNNNIKLVSDKDALFLINNKCLLYKHLIEHKIEN